MRVSFAKCKKKSARKCAAPAAVVGASPRVGREHAAHPVAAAAEREGQVVRHAQQLPEEDAALGGGAETQRRHPPDRPLHARLLHSIASSSPCRLFPHFRHMAHCKPPQALMLPVPSAQLTIRVEKTSHRPGGRATSGNIHPALCIRGRHVHVSCTRSDQLREESSFLAAGAQVPSMARI